MSVLGQGAGYLLVSGGRVPLVSAAALDDASPTSAIDLAPDPNDPIAILFGRRLAFANGEPHVTVRISEGQKQFTFRAPGSVRLRARGKDLKTLRPQRGAWTVRLVGSQPGRSVTRVNVAEHLFAESDAAETDAQMFHAHGYKTSIVIAGSVYGIAGRSVDTRHRLVLVEGDGTEATARRLLDEIGKRFAIRPSLHREPIERAHGTIAVVNPRGEVVLSSVDALSIDVDGEISVEKVEHSMGYPNHGFEDRRYTGRIFAAIDAQGLLAAVNLVPLETLTKGIVPSEIFPSAHREALKAQAVTARGEILAKVGARHIGDPYLLCAEQHCQVFRGVSGEHPSASRAVEETRGEALFSARTGALVPSYYSAICGGHTEDNDKVWGGPPNPSIRGRPDFPLSVRTQEFSDGIGEALLRRWLAADVPSFCRSASVAKPDKYRWTRAFAQTDVDAITEPFRVGSVTTLDIDGRGISGRARTLVIEGGRGSTRVHSELAIRRLFRMLPSGMFVIDTEGSGRSKRYTFRGGGWGHGAGMCQTGAIGRAELGATYREILKFYYSGADVVRMYG